MSRRGSPRLVMGTNDLAKETRARMVPGRAPMLPWLMNCVAAARAYGIDILDGVYNDLGNAEGFARECARGARHGLRRQDADPSEPDRALQRRVLAERRGGRAGRKIIAAFDLPENKGKGVVALDGRMVERLHADMARRTVAIAQAIAARRRERRCGPGRSPRPVALISARKRRSCRTTSAKHGASAQIAQRRRPEVWRRRPE